ncbi:twin-arginine translocation pathway signal sequence domain protein, putative [Roseovarius nubinhibens ISM]|uniref:Twin-arginine translocation pathway signal sequence domain protein, putative n=2 Tax=Roseovarius nubinhibens TaxID=314263 RepID=A3SK67_ROSNI|nr:twin-arginine translocation pathway signal sequence domain protein, putative [Roseovarius nubinhibens ISM]
MIQTTRRSLLTVSAAALALATLPRVALAATAPIFAEGGIAINGTDPVAYFTENRPVAGDPQFSTDYMGATWYFASAENLDQFRNAPEEFAPQFGGYCAYAASKGYIAPTVPEAWTIYEGKLYLNANLRARELWLEDIPGNIALAQDNWPNILK